MPKLPLVPSRSPAAHATQIRPIPLICRYTPGGPLAPAKQQVNVVKDCDISASSPALAQLAGLAGAGLSQISRKALPAMSRHAAPPESALSPDKLDTGAFARNMLTVGVKSQKLVL